MNMRSAAMPAAVCAAVLPLLLLAAAAQAQQMYRWVDKNGRVTYSQDPPPAGAAKSVQQRRFSGSTVETSNLPYAAQLAARNFPVTLYTAPDCEAPCKEGRDALSKRGIPYREVVVGNEESITALKNLTGKTQVPVLQVGRQASTGFNAADWNRALDLAGYPSSVPPGVKAPATVQRKLPPVRLFTTAQCGLPCQNARALLSERGVAFQETLVQSEEDVEELKKVAGERGLVPVLLIGGSSIQGFDPTRYAAGLDTAGFPRAGSARK